MCIRDSGRRGGGADDEHMGVLYRTDALRLVESGDFWLSDTPDVVGSITWGNLYPRMVTWGLFESRDDGRRFYLFNTHFPYRDEDDAARTRCAQAPVSYTHLDVYKRQARVGSAMSGSRTLRR